MSIISLLVEAMYIFNSSLDVKYYYQMVIVGARARRRGKVIYMI
jgi:hypothetical protein